MSVPITSLPLATALTGGEVLPIVQGGVAKQVSPLVVSQAANTAAAIANVPAGGISATNVQSALNELDTKKLALASLGTGVATALAVNVGSAGAPVVNGGALGTPSSGTVTNLTGTASININGTVGATTPSTGAFTTLSATGNVTLGDASTDTLNVGNGGLVKDASGNVGIGTAGPLARLDVADTNATVYTTSSASLASPDGCFSLVRNTNTTAGNAALQLFFSAATGGSQWYQGLVAGASFSGAYVIGNRTSTSAYAERMRIDASGNVGIGLAPTARNNTRLQIVDGIGFPATQVASSDANTLDDYEEGSWTPTISGSTSAGVGTYGTQLGRYTKVGNKVTIHANIAISAHTGTGNFRLTGFPFTSDSTSGLEPAVTIGFVSSITLTANNYLMGVVIENSTRAELYQYPVGGGSATAVPLDTACNIAFSCTYQV